MIRGGQECLAETRVSLPLCWLLLGFATHSAASEGPDSRVAGFVVETAALRVVDGRYVADASIDFGFSEDIVEAMRNGVALTVIVDVEVRRMRAAWWYETLVAPEFRFRVETSVLTDRYRIRDLYQGVTTNFRSFDEMVDALGHLESIPVVAEDRLAPDGRYTARVRARLDIEALPSPLRPIAYLSPQWRLNSGWFECPIQR